VMTKLENWSNFNPRDVTLTRGRKGRSFGGEFYRDDSIRFHDQLFLYCSYSHRNNGRFDLRAYHSVIVTFHGCRPNICLAILGKIYKRSPTEHVKACFTVLINLHTNSYLILGCGTHLQAYRHCALQLILNECDVIFQRGIVGISFTNNGHTEIDILYE